MKEKDSKFTQYLLDCGIRSGWHDKEIDEFTNDPRALETVMQYVDNVGEMLRNGVGLYLWGCLLYTSPSPRDCS